MEDFGNKLPLPMEDYVIDTETIKQIIADQTEESYLLGDYVHRTEEQVVCELMENQEIVVLTGVRRSGKSVLLQHIRGLSAESNYYFNFEDERLINFTAEHFQLLLETFIELYGVEQNFFFDEIQNIPGWEMFARRLYNRGAKIYITGSNATLFSDELGTRLTGRYIQINLYPYSFYEYANNLAPEIIAAKNLSTTQLGTLKQLQNDYFSYGGFPAYVFYKQKSYLQALYESIIHRDIVVRYKLNNDIAIKKLVYQLASNCSKTITFNSLRKITEIGSTTTISDYCGYLEKSYLCFFVNKFSPSLKQQNLSAKKVYFIDHVLAKVVGFRISEDKGRMLENIVFIELKRRGNEVYYHNEKKECDFLVFKNNRIVQAVQVCITLADDKTHQRKFAGLLDAMKTHNLEEGLIITENEEKTEYSELDKKQVKIKLVPFYKWACAYKMLP